MISPTIAVDVVEDGRLERRGVTASDVSLVEVVLLLSGVLRGGIAAEGRVGLI